MAAALLLVLSALLCARAWGAGSVWTSKQEVDSRVHLTCRLNDSNVEITGHRWMRGNKVLLEDSQPGLKMDYYMSPDDHSGTYSCIFLPETAGRGEIKVSGNPKVKATKKMENGDEGESVVLSCTAESDPPVVAWRWFRVNESGEQQLIDNHTHADKYFVVSGESYSKLHVQNLHVEEDPGKYSCEAQNDLGRDSEVIVLRVRKHLAALWPFLGIVAEVLVLVTIIFIYEKRQKKGENLDDEDTGSQPLKSTPHMNDQGKELGVRQRNAT
ncbi:LOW QUALITY PROTEIN: basigin [Sorex fumeus]|uniref:LOW QUALITY PROTEIN: basigin n=1 Tax=Sorex fumeus TaxID=62283 RepID=UPI0024AE6EE1|nr:LOW QUALITY PROTEIN: basigin [Sorex fumeus]